MARCGEPCAAPTATAGSGRLIEIAASLSTNGVGIRRTGPTYPAPPRVGIGGIG